MQVLALFTVSPKTRQLRSPRTSVSACAMRALPVSTAQLRESWGAGQNLSLTLCQAHILPQAVASPLLGPSALAILQRRTAYVRCKLRSEGWKNSCLIWTKLFSGDHEKGEKNKNEGVSQWNEQGASCWWAWLCVPLCHHQLCELQLPCLKRGTAIQVLQFLFCFISELNLNFIRSCQMFFIIQRFQFMCSTPEKWLPAPTALYLQHTLYAKLLSCDPQEVTWPAFCLTAYRQACHQFRSHWSWELRKSQRLFSGSRSHVCWIRSFILPPWTPFLERSGFHISLTPWSIWRGNMLFLFALSKWYFIQGPAQASHRRQCFSWPLQPLHHSLVWP